MVTAALPDGGTGLFMVTADADGLSRSVYPTHDGGRAARIPFGSTPAEALGDGADATVALGRSSTPRASPRGRGARPVSALTATRDYLTSRKQFGVTLKTFQALTFRAADMYVALELTRSMVLWATMVLAEGSPEEGSVAASRAGLQVGPPASGSGRRRSSCTAGSG